MFKKRAAIIGCSFLALTLWATLFYREALVCFGIEQFLGHYMPIEGGWRFRAEKMQYRGQKCVLSKIKFSSQGIQGTIEELVVGVKELELVLQNMNLVLEKEGPSMFSLATLLEGPKTIVEDSKLTLIEGDKKTNFLFSLALQEESFPSGSLYLSFAEGSESNLFMRWFQTKEGWKTEIETEEAHLKELATLVNFFQKDPSAWEVLEGRSTGSCTIGFNKEKAISQCKSSLALAEFSARHKENKIEIGGEKASFLVAYPSSTTNPEATFWDKVGIQGSLFRGKVSFLENCGLEELTGNLSFSSLKEAEISLQGELNYKGEHSPLLLTGRPNNIDNASLDFALKLLLEPEATQSTYLNLSLKEEEDGWALRGTFQEVGVEEVVILQHIVGIAFPPVKDVQVLKGQISCSLSAHFQEHGILDKLQVDALTAKDLQMYWNSRDLFASFLEIKGDAGFKGEGEALFTSPTWHLSVSDGDILYGQKSAFPVMVSTLDMELSFCKNIFEPSWIRALYKGIDIDAKLFGSYDNIDWKMHLGTDVVAFLSLFGKEVKEEEEITLSTDLKIAKVEKGFRIEGTLFVDGKEKEEAIEYGFSLAEAIKNLEKGAPFSSVKETLSEVYYTSDESSFLFLEVLEKALNLNWSLSGRGSFHGTWDKDIWRLSLKGSHLLYASPDYNVESRKEFIGNVLYNAKEQYLDGFFPLKDATIEDKNTKLVFHDTNGELLLFKEGARCSRVKTEVEGLLLEGEFLIDSSSKKGSKWKIDVKNVVGSAKQLQNILSHFKGWEGFSLPFDGRIEAAEEGLSFLLDFKEEGTALDFSTHLHFLHGTYTLFPDVRLHDLAFTLDWESTAKSLLLTDITGRICSLEGKKEMPFYGKYVALEENAEGKKELFFDLRLEEEWMSLVRLLGNYALDTGKVEIYPEYSHFMGEKINRLSFEMKEGVGIKALSCQMPLSLASLPKMVRLLGDFGLQGDFSSYLASFVTGHTELMHEMMTLDVSLEKERWQFLCQGKNLFLEGFGEGNLWEINRFEIGAYKASALVKKESENFLIESCTLTSPYGRANFLSGIIDMAEKKITFPLSASSIFLPEIVLDELEGAAVLDFSIAPLSIGAKVSVKGGYGGEDPLKFHSITPLLLNFSFDKGFTIAASTFTFAKESRFSLECDVPTLIYNRDEAFFSAKGIKVSLTKDSMEHLKKEPLFRDFAPQIEVLPTRIDGLTSFTFDVEKIEDKFKLKGFLEKGSYLWQAKKVPLEYMTFEYDQKRLDLYIHTSLFGEELGIEVNSLPQSDFLTTVKAFPIVKGEMQKGKEAILLECKGASRETFVIEKWEGSLFGCDYNFLPNASSKEKGALTFLASVNFDMEKFASFLRPALKTVIREVQLKKGVTLKGELKLIKEDLSKASFEGFLQGKDFDLLGSVLQTFFAEIRFNSDMCLLEKIKISDSAINLDIASLAIKNTQERGWTLEIPEIKIDDLRPSLLRKRGEAPHKMRPFRIKSFSLTDIKGDLASPETFTGKGSLAFVNTFKEGLILLDLPLEILSRLGLDMALLVPIQGEMDMVLRDGKIVFTKLKNSFSEGKRSTFYFPNRTESYMDFHGNVSMDIRMKQFVLFKITQPFTLSIRGTLGQPKIALR
ncbi:MAG: hypothetical protein JSR76_08740 [Verrucomicrobia bacterium]|nr:hypothetical protein [Verrucomicrobiota bacterium]